MSTLRDKLVRIALEWEKNFGVAPAITSALAEYDAACLLACPEREFGEGRKSMTAVSKGFDFVYRSVRYQVKANRPSGKRGSPVTLVSSVRNYEWDRLIWILYNKEYEIVEAWIWNVDDYKVKLAGKKRLSPQDMRQGKQLFKR